MYLDRAFLFLVEECNVRLLCVKYSYLLWLCYQISFGHTVALCDCIRSDRNVLELGNTVFVGLACDADSSSTVRCTRKSELNAFDVLLSFGGLVYLDRAFLFFVKEGDNCCFVLLDLNLLRLCNDVYIGVYCFLVLFEGICTNGNCCKLSYTISIRLSIHQNIRSFVRCARKSKCDTLDVLLSFGVLVYFDVTNVLVVNHSYFIDFAVLRNSEVDRCGDFVTFGCCKLDERVGFACFELPEIVIRLVCCCPLNDLLVAVIDSKYSTFKLLASYSRNLSYLYLSGIVTHNDGIYVSSF